MKKIIALLVFITMLSLASTAQNYEQGDMNLNAGFGLGTSLTGSILVPPVNASFEYGVADNIGVSLYTGYAKTENVTRRWDGSKYKWKYGHVFFGARGTYHLYSTNKINTYAGAELGYSMETSDKFIPVSDPDDFGDDAAEELEKDIDALTFGVLAGIRYSFTDMMGAYAELGYGVSIFELGLDLRLD